MIVVFDFGIGQRGLFDHRPHDGLGAAIERPAHQELADFAYDVAFGLERHRLIWIFPIADDAEALELFPLDIDPLGGEVAALGAEFDDGHGVLIQALLAVLLFDLPFDRQAVAVPTRHVVGIEAGHLARADDGVFEDLIERVADVEMAVGIRRTVMQDEFLAALRGLPQKIVHVHLLPAREQLGLELRQTGLHREVGGGQKDGGAIIRRL